MGFIVRCHFGRVIHSWIGYTTTLSNEEAKFIAYYKAVQHVLNHKFIAIYIEGDTKIAIDAFKMKEWKLLDLNTQHILHNSIQMLYEFFMLLVR